MMKLKLMLIITYCLGSVRPSNDSFPEDFLFGVGSSAYQIEGAWNEGGRGESVWDYLIHKNASRVEDLSNGDVACDSYHLWREDVKLLKELGVNFYRFSISWTRILPKGLRNTEPNIEGIAYYSNLIDELLSQGIKPYVTIFHWDTPLSLHQRGGWLNETIIEEYVHYARVLFTLFGDRVKHWMTFNEFYQICEGGYSLGREAPYIKKPGVGGYECFYICVRAHAIVYRMYEKEFKPFQKGQIGVSIDGSYGLPKTDSEMDRKAAEQYMQMDYGWFVHPIILGNYPQIMIDRIDELSRQEGFTESRLPKFSEEEIQMVKGSFDFLGLNHYTSLLCTFDGNNIFPEPSHEADSGVVTSVDPSWKGSASSWLFEVPEGIRKHLIWIKENYGNPPVLITENGWSMVGKELKDVDRMIYLKKYLRQVLKAIKVDGCNVKGYSIWSFMDSFEWGFGYTEKFGLVHVDFNDTNRTRIPRSSYHMYREIINKRRLEDS